MFARSNEMEQKETQIAMAPVKSSNLTSCWYCPDTETLAVEFKHGGSYHFAKVPSDIAETFLQAKSIGKAFHSMIRGQYVSAKIETSKEKE